MQTSVKAHEEFPIVGAIDPDAYAAGTYTTGWIDAKDAEQFMATLQVGAMGSNATVDAKFEQATSAAGAGAKDVAGKAITQMTQAGTDESDRQKTVVVRQEDLDINNGFNHVRFSVTIGTAAVDMSALVNAAAPRYGGSKRPQATTVSENV